MENLDRRRDEMIKVFKKEIELNFLESLSSTIFDKQMLFKQENGRYYSKYHGCELELDEVEMWLLDNIRDLKEE